MEKKSTIWLFTSVSIFIAGCIITYFVMCHHSPDMRYNYSVNSRTKAKTTVVVPINQKTTSVAKNDSHDSIAATGKTLLPKQAVNSASNEVTEAVKFSKLAKANVKSDKGNSSIQTQTEPDSEKPADVAVVKSSKTEDVSQNKVTAAEPAEQNMSEELTINALNDLMPVSIHKNAENHNAIVTRDVTTNAPSPYVVVSSPRAESFVDDPFTNADPRMGALGGGSQDPLNTGGGSDNTSTYNDNNVMGSLPLGDSVYCLLVFVLLFSGIKIYRLESKQIM